MAAETVPVRAQGPWFQQTMPEGAIYVGRGEGGLPRSKFASPFKVKPHGPYELDESLRLYGGHLDTCPAFHEPSTPCALYSCWNPATMDHPRLAELASVELAGRDLARRCKLPESGEPDLCHASILLELAGAA